MFKSTKCLEFIGGRSSYLSWRIWVVSLLTLLSQPYTLWPWPPKVFSKSKIMLIFKIMKTIYNCSRSDYSLCKPTFPNFLSPRAKVWFSEFISPVWLKLKNGGKVCTSGRWIILCKLVGWKGTTSYVRQEAETYLLMSYISISNTMICKHLIGCLTSSYFEPISTSTESVQSNFELKLEKAWVQFWNQVMWEMRLT